MPGLGDLQKPKGDSENIHPAYRTGRNMIGRSLERSQATGTGLRWLSGRTSHVNRALEPPDPESRGYLDEFTGSFTHSLTAANYDMLGSAVEAAGILMGDEQGAVFARTGYEMQVRSQGFDTGKPGSVHSWSEVKDVDTALRFLIGGAGQGLGSTVPSLVTGTLGALAGGRLRGRTGATIGSLAGAALPSYALNLGEAFRQFKEEGVDQKSAAGWAVGMAVPISALDTAGLFKTVGGLNKPLKRAIYSRIARGIAQGMAAEGGTEWMQSVIRETTAAFLTGNPDIQARALRTIDEATIGAVTGGTIGGPMAALPRGDAAAAEETDDIADDLPGVEPAPGEPDATFESVAALPPPGPADQLAIEDQNIIYGRGARPDVIIPPITSEQRRDARPEPEGPVLAGEPETAIGRLRRVIADIKSSTFEVKKEDGRPFKGAAPARLAARNRRLHNHVPKKVEGGWALVPENLYPPADGSIRSPAPVAEPTTYPGSEDIVSPVSKMVEAIRRLDIPSPEASRIADAVAAAADSLPVDTAPSQIAEAGLGSLGIQGSEIANAVVDAAASLPDVPGVGLAGANVDLDAGSGSAIAEAVVEAAESLPSGTPATRLPGRYWRGWPSRKAHPLPMRWPVLRIPCRWTHRFPRSRMRWPRVSSSRM